MSELPKYSKLEIERRFLVDAEKLDLLNPEAAQQITDKYLANTLLRVRKVVTKQSTIFKLCKKYGFEDDTYQPVTNIYLTNEEYDILNALDGASVVKLRYPLEGGGLDVYRYDNKVFYVFEIEFSSTALAEAYLPPSFVTEEITKQARFRGIDFVV